jgi:uncharacterized membrane protein YfhO
VDGTPTRIYKTNYAFRGIIVPPGTHTVEFRYRSEAFEQGRTVSLAVNIAVLGLLGFGAWQQWRNRQRNQRT